MADEDVPQSPKRQEHPRLVRTGVIVTIAASLAGLITTGVATLFGALVSQDQLDQSGEAAEEKKRAQAARISFWTDLQQDGKSRLHLMNRSPDPISTVQMIFTVLLPPDGYPEEDVVLFRAALPSVPPCSDMVFTFENLAYNESPPRPDHYIPVLPGSDSSPLNWPIFKKEWEVEIEEVAVDFTDREGVRWRRERGLLTREPGKHVMKGTFMSGAVEAVSPQPLKLCGT
ncbi:hypothetical protein [Streptomyces sp. NPDC002057]|uniref:hypothetical protein n=1 Tax=Streptomyces sp. NPDC002057 TaxID=3154664 RepID=UPI003324A7FC